jgi:spore germination cell wall hydrolase CwlJ-like protein
MVPTPCQSLLAEGRPALTSLLSILVVLFASPTSSAEWGAGTLDTLSQVTRVNLGSGIQDRLQEERRIEAINLTIPANPGAAVAAPKFSLGATGLAEPFGTSALDCMTAAIYYEAANEPITGQRAVAQVIINRVRHPAFPDSVCGVVFEGSNRSTGCQFTFTCDGSLLRKPSSRLWLQARGVALAALGGFVETSVGHATHYHASYVRPYWAPKLTKLTAIGSHIFYQWPGGWARPAAFTDAYSANEIMPLGARSALAGYVSAQAPTQQEFVAASSSGPADDFANAAASRTALQRSGPEQQKENNAMLPETTLIVGKHELIERKAKMKDSATPVIAQ